MRTARAILPWIIPAGAVAAWQLFTHTRASGGMVPAPGQIASAAVALIGSGELARHAWVSLQRALIGLAFGGGLGLVLGLANGYWPLAERLFDTPLQMIRNVPHLALIPLVILWFGLGERPKILLVAMG